MHIQVTDKSHATVLDEPYAPDFNSHGDAAAYVAGRLGLKLDGSCGSKGQTFAYLRTPDARRSKATSLPYQIHVVRAAQADRCDECRAAIPMGAELVNTHHATACGLHPSAQESGPARVSEETYASDNGAPCGKCKGTIYTYEVVLAAGQMRAICHTCTATYVVTFNAIAGPAPDSAASCSHAHRLDYARKQARELATILAALRLWQDIIPEAHRAAFEHFYDQTPLTNTEIDALCERLNLGGK